MVNKRPETGFIGAGTVGTALAVLLQRQGYPVIAVASRSRASAEKLARQVPGCRAVNAPQDVADTVALVFITTPDDAIARVAAAVKWRPENSVVHCSGAASTDILEPAKRAGARVGTIHPLQTLAGVEQAIANIPGSTFGIEAEGQLLDTLKMIATELKGQPIALKPSDKVLYHAAAVIACNYLVTLVKLATDLWQTFNVPTDTAAHALLPLVQGTLNNIAKIGIPGCLTGPIARGDTGTIRNHIAALDRAAPGILKTYRDLGKQTVPVALAKGKISEGQAKELEEILAGKS
ncbi:MAG: DUF2520 domain-containing protein [Chloroflexota bacterium]